jgi:hypothetical protein
MYQKMTAGISFYGIKVDGKLIRDGHHRYLALLMANNPLERVSGIKTSATRQVDWKFVVFEEDH